MTLTTAKASKGRPRERVTANSSQMTFSASAVHEQTCFSLRLFSESHVMSSQDHTYLPKATLARLHQGRPRSRELCCQITEQPATTSQRSASRTPELGSDATVLHGNRPASLCWAHWVKKTWMKENWPCLLSSKRVEMLDS